MTFRGITNDNDNNNLQQSIYTTILQFTNLIKSHCISQFSYFFLSAVSTN